MKRIVPTVVIEARTLLREGVTALLHGTAYRIVHSCSSVSDMSEPGVMSEPHMLAILGVSGSTQDTMDAVRALRDRSPECKIVAIGERGDLSALYEIMCCGIDGLLLNVASAEALLKAFDLVMLGQQVIILDRRQLIGPAHHDADLVHETAPLSVPDDDCGSESLNGEIHLDAACAPSINGGEPVSVAASVQLSNRERQVLACVARGDANKLIARYCSITEATVKAHLKAILRKIAVRNRTQAALWAIDKGFAPEFHSGRPDYEPRRNVHVGDGHKDREDDRVLASNGGTSLSGRSGRAV